MTDDRLYAPAALRNREPIRDVLAAVLPPAGLALEIASGTGEHAAFLAGAFPGVVFQPSDPDARARASIAAWRAASGLENLLAPLALDAAATTWPLERADAVLCVNMIHIAPWEAAIGLMRGAARLLAPSAPLYLYGPYRREGRHTAPSNESFDASLRARNPAWGVRDLEAVADLAAESGFGPPAVTEMPANNLSVVFLSKKGRP